MFSRRVHPVAAAAAAISGETNTDSNRGVLERGAPPREEEEEFIFDDTEYFEMPRRSQDSVQIRLQENNIRQLYNDISEREDNIKQAEDELREKKSKMKPKEIEQREFRIKLRKESLQDQIDVLHYQENILKQQKENIEKKRIQRKERIIAEMEAERLAEINRPPPAYYSSSPVPAPTAPVPAPTVPVPAPVVRRPWYHRLADRIDNADWNRAAPPTAAQTARRRARRTRREEAALRREERRKKSLKEKQDAYHKGLYEIQKDKLEELYIKYPNGIPDTEFTVYPLYHKTSNPEIRRIPKPYSYDKETETKKKKPNLLKKLKRLLTQKNVIPRKKSPVPPPILPPVPPKILTLPAYSSPNLPPAYSSRKYKLRSTQRDYNAGGMRSSRKKKTRRVKRS